jgi:hypothetical protein
MLLAAVHPASAYWIENGAVVCANDSTQIIRSIAPDGSGGAIIVWEDQSNLPSSRSLYAQHINERGELQWTSGGVFLGTTSGSFPSVELLADGSGGAFAVYTSGDVLFVAYCTVARISSDGVLLWSNSPFVTGGSVGNVADITTDGSGGCFVCWDDDRDGSRTIYAQRFDADGNRLWYHNGESVCPVVTSNQRSPQMTFLGSAVTIVWKDYRSEVHGELYAQKIDALGARQWALYGVPVCTGSQTKDEIQIITDNAGRAVIAWVDSRNAGTTSSDIYMQTLNSLGNPDWTVDGLVVCEAVYQQLSPQMIPHGIGGAIVIWIDKRNLGTTNAIYGQYVEGHGVPQWGTDGKALSSASSWKEDPRITPVQDDAIVSWADDRGGESDIYAQKFDGNGDELWASGGIAITDDGFQESPLLVSDGANGAIFAWNDNRIEYEEDIRAHRIHAEGLLANPPPIILSILDIPEDEGGYARIELKPSNRDLAAIPFPQVSFYNVWRRIESPTPALQSAGAWTEPRSCSEILAQLEADDSESPLRLSPAEAALVGLPSGSWESIGLHVAMQQASYYFTVPTRQDSTQSSTHWENFVVSAHTLDPDLFFISSADSGYSVDNIAPVPPLALTGAPNYGTLSLELSWSPNAEGDLWYYGVYRGTEADFVPSAENRVAAPTVAEWTDDEWNLSVGYFYKVSAVDIHGNESGFAVLEPDQVTGVETPRAPGRSYLSQNVPNPFNPSTTIRYELGRASGQVKLQIFDVSGRLVNTLVDGAQQEGPHSVQWNGLDDNGQRVATGAYFYRLTAPGFIQTRKMVMLN